MASKRLSAAQRRAQARKLSASKKAEETFARKARAYTQTEMNSIAVAAAVATESELIGLILGNEKKLTAAVEGWLQSAFKEVLASNKEALDLGLSRENEKWIKPFLEEKAAENVGYFSENMQKSASEIYEIVHAEENVGMRAEDLATLIEERIGVATGHAEFVARDQVLKMNGAVNQERQKQAGITKYIWSTSKDDRVREEHANLEGDVFSWDGPPEPGHPSDDYLCRCIAVPLLEDLIAVDDEE